MKTALLLFVTMLLVACEPAGPRLYTGWVGRTMNGPGVNLERYQPPEQLGAFRLQGQISFPERPMRLFRYRHTSRKQRVIDIALYPFPAGWTSLEGRRVVAGHYGQVKRSLAERVSQLHGSRVELLSQALYHPDELAYPVAEGRLREYTDRWSRTLLVEVTAIKPVFVRVTANFPEQPDPQLVQTIRQAIYLFIRHQDPPPRGAGTD